VLLRRLNHSLLLPALLAPAIPYGGQAAMEGVMMKGTRHAALAMRRASGELELLDREVKTMFPGLTRLPLLRGFFILWDMFVLGLWALRESSKRYETDLLAAEAAKSGKPVAQRVEDRPNWVQYVVLGISLVIALLIFKVVPAAAVTGIFSVVGWGAIKELAEPTLAQQFLANLIEGVIKLGIFVGYIWGVGRIKEIARVFEYHGAEHIVINAYDNANNQDIGFIRSHSVAHPRCGTSFIAILIVASIVLFTFLDWALVTWFPALVVDNIPVVHRAGPCASSGSIAWRASATRPSSQRSSTTAIRWCGLRRHDLQALTTRRPSDDQVRVSLASFNRARYLTEGIPNRRLPQGVHPAFARIITPAAMSPLRRSTSLYIAAEDSLKTWLRARGWGRALLGVVPGL
jgi:uncharacterized protein YqhQ